MVTLIAPATVLDGPALDVALARADAYRVLAAYFRDPDAPRVEEQPEPRVLRSALKRLGVDLPAATWPSLRRIAARDDRAREHRAVFGHVVAHGCPPYETEYGRRHVFGQSQDLGDIRGFYEAFGVRPRTGGERPDHLACELEFLGLLALKEAMALAAGDAGRTGLTRDAARTFIVDHPGRWVRALAARIEQRAPGSGYAAAAAIAAAVLDGHGRALGALPMALGPDDLVPITEIPDGLTFECGPDAEAGDLLPPGAEP